MRTFKILLPPLALLVLSNAVYAVDTHAKVWLSSAYTGPLSEDKKVRFYIEPDVRFIDNKYKFEQALLWLGIGYQLSPNLIFHVGNTPVTRRRSNGEYRHQNIVWQQAGWTIFNSDSYRFVSRSRLEQVKENHQAQWAITYRQRLQFEYQLKNWDKHSIVVSDEVFFSLKSPEWVGNSSFISQNRAYIGLDTRITRIVSVSIGYMNQFQFTNPNRMSNILVLGSDFNFG